MADEKNILTLEETAQYLRKSTSWVYKNWKILGGRKLGGSEVEAMSIFEVATQKSHTESHTHDSK